MWYIIHAYDHPNVMEQRMANRADHVARLQQLQDQGRLLIAGPIPAIDSEDPGEAGFIGSLVVVEFESLEHARSWAEQDPYSVHGVYEKVTVEPYLKLMP